MILQRDLSKDIVESAQSFPVIAIVGPRQSGKSTLAQTVFNNYIYVTLEDPDARVSAKNDPRTFLTTLRNEFGLIIDEFQYVPELLSYIQTIVDKEQKPGTFILTGSQNFLMNESITQSLAGRVAIHTLLPLSIHELDKNNVMPDEIEELLYKGCYPAIYAKHIAPQKLYRNYVQTYLERDVRLLAHVGDLLTFQKFITMCAMRIGQVVNLTSLANDCGISDNTAKRWLSILQASYVIFLLRPYHTQFGRRLIKAPKLYFYDPGLACYLLQIKESEIALHPSKGNIFESFIISEVLKWYYNHDQEPHIYFWRDSQGFEIDCLIEEGITKLIPLEIKASRTIYPHLFEGLSHWEKISGRNSKKGRLVFGGTKRQTIGYPNLISWQSIDGIFNTENEDKS